MPFSLQDFEFYRFLLAYVFKGSNGTAAIPTCNPIVPAANISTNCKVFGDWLTGPAEKRYQQSTQEIFLGPIERFVIPASHNGNYEIKGQINFFVGLAV
jgi:hypothetical protein